MTQGYQFTNNWFEVAAKGVWDWMIPQFKPVRILEIGSYEGAATCYLIENFSKTDRLEIRCIDTWEGSVEHKADGIDMSEVEKRFHHNTKLANSLTGNNAQVIVHKGYSDAVMAILLSSGHEGYFDFIYIDGSHQAPDVLCDAVMAFKLLRQGGLLAFDDYLWHESLSYGPDPIRCPKMAIDAFTNIYFRKVRILSAPLYQMYCQKISD